MILYSQVRFWKAYTTTLSTLSSYFSYAFWHRIFPKRVGEKELQTLHQRNGRKLQKVIYDLKGLFIKVGQMISIMSNFLPEALTRELEGMQDAVPPHLYKDIEARFFQEFKKGPKELFKSFEETPIASASLGQVHIARLRDNTKVAVKIQYPNIDKIVTSDLVTLRRIFKLLHLLFPTYGLREVYQEISQVVLQELDYQYEGKNLELMRQNFKEEAGILFPEVYWDYSTSKVLTTRFMEGIKVSNLERLKQADISTREVATRIIHAYCKQIFIDGVYHADPHPGNLLVKKENGSFKIVLVDFGATARISNKMREGITHFVEGLMQRDSRRLSDAIREMGFVARGNEGEAFDRLVEYFYDKIRDIKIENFKNFQVGQFHKLEDLLELKKMNISFRDLMSSFYVPKDWILLERALLLTIGVCTHLDPTLNPIEIVLPYVEKFVLKDKSFSDVAVSISKQVALSYLQLPHEIQKTLRKLYAGEIELSRASHRRHTQKMYRLGHQAIYTFLMIVSVSFVDRFPSYALYSAGFFAMVLLISFWRNRR